MLWFACGPLNISIYSYNTLEYTSNYYTSKLYIHRSWIVIILQPSGGVSSILREGQLGENLLTWVVKHYPRYANYTVKILHSSVATAMFRSAPFLSMWDCHFGPGHFHLTEVNFLHVLRPHSYTLFMLRWHTISAMNQTNQSIL